MFHLDLKKKFCRLSGIILFATALAGCATPPSDPEALARYEEINDPLEPVNRVIFDFNLLVDEYFLEPAAKGYVYVVPEFVRQRISHLIDYLRLPLTFVAQILQGEFAYAGDTTGRFLINTITLGFNDAATEAGIPNRKADIGQTFAKWGIGEGPYVVLPFLGPHTTRHAVGEAFEYLALNPVTQWEKMDGHEKFLYIHSALAILNMRAENLEEIEIMKNSSLDLYVAARSAYRQIRRERTEDGFGADLVPDEDSSESDENTGAYEDFEDPLDQ